MILTKINGLRAGIGYIKALRLALVCMLFLLPGYIIAAPYWLLLENDVLFENVQAEFPKNISSRYYSPALHALSVNAPNSEILKNIPGVKSIRPLARLRYAPPVSDEPAFNKNTNEFYGAMYLQLAMLKIPQIHAQGITGRGVRIGVIDTGFKKSLPAFERILTEGRLIGERDFVFGDDDTDDDPAESSLAFATHGTGCWSQIGAYIEGEMVGAAYDAEFLLAKTEDIRSETPVEEDNFVAAIEWFHSHDADVISSSLAYLDFDGEANDYSFEDLDGKTTMVAQICNWADRQGMIIVNAIGNEGPRESTLWSPADAEGVISVGSVDNEMRVSYFSSRGPTADGRIKPDIAALGQSCALASLQGGVRYGTGTSFATPQIAGAVALLRSVFPAWTREDMLFAFRKHSYLSEKSNDLGWGLPDFEAILRDFQSQAMANIQIEAFPNPARFTINLRWDNLQPRVSLKLYNLLGQELATYQSVSYEPVHLLNLPVAHLPAGVYLISAEKSSVRFIKF